MSFVILYLSPLFVSLTYSLPLHPSISPTWCIPLTHSVSFSLLLALSLSLLSLTYAVPSLSLTYSLTRSHSTYFLPLSFSFSLQFTVFRALPLSLFLFPRTCAHLPHFICPLSHVISSRVSSVSLSHVPVCLVLSQYATPRAKSSGFQDVLLHTSLPQRRQWCRRLISVNFTPHSSHVGLALSGVHLAGGLICGVATKKKVIVCSGLVNK